MLCYAICLNIDADVAEVPTSRGVQALSSNMLPHRVCCCRLFAVVDGCAVRSSSTACLIELCSMYIHSTGASVLVK